MTRMMDEVYMIERVLEVMSRPEAPGVVTDGWLNQHAAGRLAGSQMDQVLVQALNALCSSHRIHLVAITQGRHNRYGYKLAGLHPPATPDDDATYVELARRVAQDWESITDHQDQLAELVLTAIRTATASLRSRVHHLEDQKLSAISYMQREIDRLKTQTHPHRC